MVTKNNDSSLDGAYAYANENTGSQNHTTPAYIKVCTPFNNRTNAEKANILGHEIGHWYGLAHVTGAYAIMISVGGLTNVPQPMEKKAIETCAHTYDPTKSTSITYKKHSASQHIKMDKNSALGWYEVHTWNTSASPKCTYCSADISGNSLPGNPLQESSTLETADDTQELLDE